MNAKRFRFLLISLFSSLVLLVGIAYLLGVYAVQAKEGAIDEPSTQNILSLPNSPHPILNELSVRQAIAFCTDRHALAQAAYPDLNEPEIDALMMDSFLPNDHWAYSQPTTQYPFDPEQGGALLDSVGWTLPVSATYRVNAQGDPLVLKLVTTWADLRVAWGEVFEQQMRDCGIWVVRNHTDPGWLFGDSTGIFRRDFEMTGFAWSIYNEQIDSIYAAYGCDQIPSAANGWQGYNLMG